MTMHTRSPAEVAHSLAEALVISSNVPVLLLDGDLEHRREKRLLLADFPDGPNPGFGQESGGIQ